MVSILFHEFFNAAGRVNQFLFACKEGMTVGTDLNLHFSAHRTKFNFVTTGALCFYFMIFWMDILFHFLFPPQKVSQYSLTAEFYFKSERGIIYEFYFIASSNMMAKLFQFKTMSTSQAGENLSPLSVHRFEELLIGLGQFHLVHQEFHGIGRIKG